MIFEGDIVRVPLQQITPSDPKHRDLVVSIRTVTREVVNHPDFHGDVSKVAITGVVFEWEGYQLFPCVDEDSVPDNSKMHVIGNIYDRSKNEVT